MDKAWVLSYPLSAQRRLWSDWADAQADLSLRWAYSHIVGFLMRVSNQASTMLCNDIRFPILIPGYTFTIFDITQSDVMFSKALDLRKECCQQPSIDKCLLICNFFIDRHTYAYVSGYCFSICRPAFVSICNDVSAEIVMYLSNEPEYDKTNKMTCAPCKDSDNISLDIHPVCQSLLWLGTQTFMRRT